MLCCGCAYFPLGKGYLLLILCPLSRGFEWFFFVTKNNSPGMSRGSTRGEASGKCIVQRDTPFQRIFNLIPASFGHFHFLFINSLSERHTLTRGKHFFNIICFDWQRGLPHFFFLFYQKRQIRKINDQIITNLFAALLSRIRLI